MLGWDWTSGSNNSLVCHSKWKGLKIAWSLASSLPSGKSNSYILKIQHFHKHQAESGMGPNKSDWFEIKHWDRQNLENLSVAIFNDLKSVLDYLQDTGGDYSKILLKLLNPESKIAWATKIATLRFSRFCLSRWLISNQSDLFRPMPDSAWCLWKCRIVKI